MMKYLPSASLNETVAAFDHWLSDASAAAPTMLSSAELKTFRQYDFPGHIKEAQTPLAWDQELRGIVRGEEWMMEQFMDSPPKSFVEIGCGLGTWVVFAKLCGAISSVGIDFHPPRMAVAQKLASLLPKNISDGIDFRFGNILETQFDAPVDVFYLKATIHHLLPLDEIFDYMFEKLAPGGRVIVHDPNGLHPLAQYRAYQDRGFNIIQTVTNAQTGEEMAIAEENFFTFPGILYRFKRHGFILEQRTGNIGFRRKANEKWYRRIIQPLGKNFLLSTLWAPSYTIVARKPKM